MTRLLLLCTDDDVLSDKRSRRYPRLVRGLTMINCVDCGAWRRFPRDPKSRAPRSERGECHRKAPCRHAIECRWPVTDARDSCHEGITPANGWKGRPPTDQEARATLRNLAGVLRVLATEVAEGRAGHSVPDPDALDTLAAELRDEADTLMSFVERFPG